MPLRRLRLVPPRSIERDVVTLTLDDEQRIDIQRVRDPRAKRVKLSVDERGARLTLPPRVSLAAGQRFLDQHRQWLSEQLARYADDADLPALVRGQTDALPLRGAMLPLEWRPARYAKLETVGQALVLQLPARASGATLTRALREFYEAQARADVGRWLPAYLPGLPRAPARLRLKVMSTQWGSLSPDGSLTLDLSLVLGRPSAFEYVLVHELCHLVHANHSKAFWDEVELRFPAWREERDYFHAHGRQLKARLRRLLLPE
jgi:hypothetical protein